MTINVFGGGNTGGPAFPVQRSVRLRSSATAYFSRTFGTPTDSTKFTWSAWVKRGALNAVRQGLIGRYIDGNNSFRLFFDTNDTLVLNDTQAASTKCNVVTNAVFRDPSAWYHILVAIDTANGTAANRQIIYVNGVQQTFSSATNYSATSLFNVASAANTLGLTTDVGPTNKPFDGYLTEVNFIDGQALTPSSFGSINSTTGVWQPIKYSGTYGTNGFYLNFQDNSAATAAAIGKDSSGNGNNWTPNNISVTAGVTYDSMLDVPTLTSSTNANFCTLNPIAFGANANRLAITNGNLAFSDSSASNYSAVATFAPTSGKWYCEMVSSSTGVYAIGLLDKTTNSESFYRNNGTYSSSFGGSGTTGYSSWTSGDVISIAWDVDAGKIWFAKNGTWQSGSPSAGTSPTNTFTAGLGLSPDVYTDNSAGTKSGTWNFGAGSGFSYTPPSGFKSLNTYNLPAPTIPNGATQFAATLYTGNGSTQSITNTVNGKSFQPDFVWVKVRDAAGLNHILANTNAGITNFLNSNTTSAESSTSGVITSSNSNGFSVGSIANVNQNTNLFVGWQWKAGGTAVTNTSGSITSSVSANPSAGFSIVTYTGISVPGTVGHGLGVAPKFLVVKSRTGGTSSWAVWHTVLTGNEYLLLESTAAKGTASTVWNGTTPTSSVFSVGSGSVPNTSGWTYVAYCFSEIAGYSKFGSYTGNGSVDGTFVYTGFRPRFILLKNSSSATDWVTFDTSRDTYNLATKYLVPNTSGAEATGASVQLDILSNGFKIRGTWVGMNASGNTIIYAAFAESPFNYSLAR